MINVRVCGTNEQSATNNLGAESSEITHTTMGVEFHSFKATAIFLW